MAAARKVPPGPIPRVRALEVGQTTVLVGWNQPSGTQPIIFWLRYRKTGKIPWTNSQYSTLKRQMLLTGLTPNTKYDIEVLASNGY